jgi:hypothetical protein
MTYEERSLELDQPAATLGRDGMHVIKTKVKRIRA